MKIKNRTITKQPIYILGTMLIISFLFISVGFSAMSTTLSIDGSTSFIPVGLIRVLSFQQDTLVGTSEVSRSIKHDSIKNTIEFDSETGYATYEVVIRNLGQIDYVLDHIDEVVYSNNQVEYIFDGFQIGNIIHAHEEKKFKVKFKYKDNVEGELVSRLNSELKFVFEEYVDTTSFKLVFNHEGACTFNGTNGITGVDCPEYEGRTYIDTGIKLYDTDNWQKDYEIGFNVDEWISADNVQQAVFVNAKYENESLKWPGLVVRKTNTGNTSNIEITQTINNGTKVAKTITITAPFSVKIFRINGIIYYVINNGEITQLQNMSNFNQQFETSTWFGAAADQNGNQMRNLNGTLSEMYIKLGKYEARTYTITFDAEGGTVSEPTRSVVEYHTIGTLPEPTRPGAEFAGWYTDATYQTKVEPTTVVNSAMTLHAKWSSTSGAKIGDNYYASINEAIQNVLDDGNEYTITVLRDVSTKLTIPAGKKIVLDCGNYTISNNAQTFILENYGELKIVNGIFSTTSTGAAAINNESTGTMTITGTRVIATGKKQAVYNNGGSLTINGDAYLSNTSTDRAALHNLANGTLTITSGTVESANYSALYNQEGTLIIGTDDTTINTTAPSFKGKTYGVQSSINYTFYDGIAKGITNAVSDVNKISTIADNSEIITGTEEIDGKTYKTLHLQPISE